jgi:hypothetical protein
VTVKTYRPAVADSYKGSQKIQKEVFAVLECCAGIVGRLLSTFRDNASVSLLNTMQFNKNIPEERRLQLCHNKAYHLAKRLYFIRRYTTISEHSINFNFEELYPVKYLLNITPLSISTFQEIPFL